MTDLSCSLSIGRPAWIPTDPVCQEAHKMASNGLTVAQIADCLGISESTLYAKQGEYKEFMDAIKRGRAEGLNKVSNALPDTGSGEW